MNGKLTRRNFLISGAAAGIALKFNQVLADTSQAWTEIREFLFQDKDIRKGSKFIRLEAPERPPNGGDVSIRIVSSYPQNKKEFIAKHYLVIDENPSPIAGVFSLSPKNGNANVGTRVRVNAYSNVRVISETGDGELHMNTAFVKASGGCSAPPMKDDGIAKLTMGKLTLVQAEADGSGETRDFQLSIMHPNYSGLQKDQVTTYFIPPHYIETITVTNSAGETVFAARGDISFSENPSFDFSYIPVGKDDVLSAKVVDSRKKVYESRWPVQFA